MNDISSKNIYEALFEVIRNEDEQKVKDFLVDHFENFTKEDREAIVVALFEEAAQKQAASANAIAAFQKEVIVLFEQLDRAKKELEKTSALLEIKEKL